MPNSRRQRCAQINFQPDDGDQSRTQHDGSDSYEVTRRGIYFHGSTVMQVSMQVSVLNGA